MILPNDTHAGAVHIQASDTSPPIRCPAQRHRDPCVWVHPQDFPGGKCEAGTSCCQVHGGEGLTRIYVKLASMDLPRIRVIGCSRKVRRANGGKDAWQRRDSVTWPLMTYSSRRRGRSWRCPFRRRRKLLSISADLCHKAIRSGQLPSLKVGRRTIVPRRPLERMLEAITCQGEKDLQALR